MGVQAMGSHEGSQQSHVQIQPLIKQNSLQSLTLDEVASQLPELGKPMGSMNLDELLKGAWSVEASQESTAYNTEQASMSLARALNDKTVDELWREIQEGEMKMGVRNVKREDESALGEMTLEDFLVKATVFSDGLGPPSVKNSHSHGMGENLNGPQLESPLNGRKMDDIDTHEKIHERRLRRKIKNRESAARSRARKMAYQNELVNKVSQLEKQNVELKKDLEAENMMQQHELPEPRYQLRRTSSASF